MTKLHEKIKEYREKANMTQERLAELVPCNPVTISKYETGKLEMSADVLQRMGVILDFKLEIADIPRASTIEERFFSEQKIKQIEDGLRNFMDKAVIRMAFEGIHILEIVNLRKKDINVSTCTLLLQKDIGDKRTFVVSPTCMSYIEEAIKETTYQKPLQLSENVTQTIILPNKDYFLRDTKDNNQPASKHFVYRLFSKVSEAFDIPSFVFQMVQRSGMLYLAKLLLVRDSVLGEEQYHEIGSKFLCPSKGSTPLPQFINGLKTIVDEESVRKIYKM